MTSGQVKLKPQKEVRPEIVQGADLANLKQSISHAIAYHAYELYESRGRSHGHDLEDWFHAEADVTQPVPVEVRESSDRLTLSAQMPGFGAGDVKIGIEPRRVLIWGNIERPSQSPAGLTAHPQVLRTVDLPTDVDPTRAEASLKDGLLDISLPKATQR